MDMVPGSCKVHSSQTSSGDVEVRQPTTLLACSKGELCFSEMGEVVNSWCEGMPVLDAMTVRVAWSNHPGSIYGTFLPFISVPVRDLDCDRVRLVQVKASWTLKPNRKVAPPDTYVGMAGVSEVQLGPGKFGWL